MGKASMKKGDRRRNKDQKLVRSLYLSKCCWAPATIWQEVSVHTALHRNHCRLPFSLPFKAGSTVSERQALEDGSRSYGRTQKEEAAHTAEIQAKVSSETWQLSCCCSPIGVMPAWHA